MSKDLVYFIPAGKSKEERIEILRNHPEIKFASLVGIDLAGNDTDEKIPMELFIKDYDDFLTGRAVQTDGSSVVLTGIAVLNNAKVDMLGDDSVNWFIDYNYEHIDETTGKPIGSLRIPAFLVHDNKRIDSRSILADSLEYVKKEVVELITKYPQIAGLDKLDINEVEDIIFTAGTELEFWVKTPADKAEYQALSAAQILQEQYWARTRGEVRTAMEKAMMMLDNYGLKPEMGHKEVGGVKAQIDTTGHLTHVMEQLEIDWRFADARQTADNELQARIVIKEVFRANGLEVTFKAKPVIGVAGNGMHTHVGIAAKLKSGKLINLFAPKDMKADFVSAIGYGAIMGLLKNYEAINPFISATNDSLNRLKPGFEAPICIVTSLGHAPDTPSRNRTILAGLIRDLENPLATRFEVRSPNPYTNTYIAIAAIYLTMIDGIKAAVLSEKTTDELLAELSKEPGVEGFYLEKDRAYRSEHDVFDDYTPEERDELFGKPPATVWENMCNLEKYPEKVAVLTAGNTLTHQIIDAFVAGALIRWRTEILNHIIDENIDLVREYKCLHDPLKANDYDVYMWEKVNTLRYEIAKDYVSKKSLVGQIREAVQTGNYDVASKLQLEMAEKVSMLKVLYMQYKKNLLEI